MIIITESYACVRLRYVQLLNHERRQQMAQSIFADSLMKNDDESGRSGTEVRQGIRELVCLYGVGITRAEALCVGDEDEVARVSQPQAKSVVSTSSFF